MKNLFSESLSKKKLAIAFASFVVFAATLVIFVNEGSKKTVALTLNGKQTVVKTHADTVRDLLDEQNVSLNSKDFVFPKANTKLKNNVKVVWKQVKQVAIVKNNEKKTVWTTAITVAELLKEQKIVLNDHDQISPAPQKPINNNMKVTLKVANHLTLVESGHPQHVWSTSTTVADFLKQQGIHLNELDRVEPSITSTVKENDVINIIRVEKVTDVVEEPVQFAVVTKKDETLAQGIQRTIAEGIQGITARQFEIILENGKEVSRKLISENRVKEKQDKIVAVGTKNLALQVSRGGISNGKEFYVKATAYTADCVGCSGNTSTGINLYANPNSRVIAVDPRVIPLGTKVYVDGYGYAIAADTGGSIKGFRIDVFFSSKVDAYHWGAKKVKIRVLN